MTMYGLFFFFFFFEKKCIAYIAKRPFMVIFLYNLYIFVWIQHGFLDNTVLTLDSSNSVIKRWCIKNKISFC